MDIFKKMKRETSFCEKQNTFVFKKELILKLSSLFDLPDFDKHLKD